MQNKIRQADTKKAVLIDMCLPIINNKLLDICKANRIAWNNSTELVFFFFKKKRTRAKPIHKLQADKSEN